MDKVERLLKAIDAIVKEEADELKDSLSEFPEVDKTVEYIEDFEKKLAKLLRTQKKHFVDGFNKSVTKEEDPEKLREILNRLMDSDEFAEELVPIAESFLTMTVTELTTATMELIDKDVSFKILSKRTTDWISSWSEQLAELMKLSTHSEIEAALTTVIENGEGIPEAVKALKDLPGFNRKRARATAITEILTASSHSQWEAYKQSPAVVGKKWKHSGSKKNKPRPDHVKLDGTVVGVDEAFDVGGEEAQYPRDPSLSTKQRVNCHCAMGPSIDKKILKLSKEEKEKLRDEALAEME